MPGHHRGGCACLHEGPREAQVLIPGTHPCVPECQKGFGNWDSHCSNRRLFWIIPQTSKCNDRFSCHMRGSSWQKEHHREVRPGQNMLFGNSQMLNSRMTITGTPQETGQRGESMQTALSKVRGSEGLTARAGRCSVVETAAVGHLS